MYGLVEILTRTLIYMITGEFAHFATDSLCVNMYPWFAEVGNKDSADYLFRHIPTGHFYIFSNNSSCFSRKEDAIFYMYKQSDIKDSVDEAFEIVDLTTNNIFTLDEFYGKR